MSRASMSASYDFSKLGASLDRITKAAEEATRPAAGCLSGACRSGYVGSPQRHLLVIHAVTRLS